MMNSAINPIDALRMMNRERARLDQVIGDNPGSAIIQLFGRRAVENIEHEIHILEN